MEAKENLSKARTDWLASEEAIVELYSELRILANAKLKRQPLGQTLQATALVHEAYIRLSKNSDLRWENKGHFFAAAAEAMRRILVDQARRKASARRGGQVTKEPLHHHDIEAPPVDQRILQVNEALSRLEAEDTTKATIVKLRFFAGLSHEEIAALIGVSEKTIRRHWNFSKIWLFQRISKSSN